MEHLFIHLRTGAWALYDDERPLSTGGSLVSLPGMTASRKITVYVPGEDVLLTKAEVPQAQQRHLAKVLPYVVEEKLAEDVGEVHLAYAVSAPGQVEVAAVRAALLQEWLAALSRVGVRPHALIPEPLALPLQPGHWTLVVDEGRIHLRTGAYSGLTVERDVAIPALEALLLGSQAVQVVDCYAPEQWVGWLQEIATRNPRLALRRGTASQGIFDMVCKEAVRGPESALNLLPHTSRPLTSSSLEWRRTGKTTARMFAAGFAAVCLLHAASIAYMNYATRSNNTKMAALYRDIFPTEGTVSNPLRQMKQRLSTGQMHAGDGFLTQLAALAAQWQDDAAAPVIQRMNYTDESRTLTLQLEAGTLDAVRLLAERLTAVHQKADIVSVTQENNRVKAQLVLQEERL